MAKKKERKKKERVGVEKELRGFGFEGRCLG